MAADIWVTAVGVFLQMPQLCDTKAPTEHCGMAEHYGMAEHTDRNLPEMLRPAPMPRGYPDNECACACTQTHVSM